jgi:hypothetical protein
VTASKLNSPTDGNRLAVARLGVGHLNRFVFIVYSLEAK